MERKQDALGRLAREPELAARRVEPVALRRDDDPLGRGCDDSASTTQTSSSSSATALRRRPRAKPESGSAPGTGGSDCARPRLLERAPTAAEPLRARALQHRARVEARGDDRRGPPRERGRDGARTRVDVERARASRSPASASAPRRRGQALPLREAPVERGQPLRPASASRDAALGERGARALSARGRRSLGGATAPGAARRRGRRPAARARRLPRPRAPPPTPRRRSRRRSSRSSRAPQAVERRGRLLVAWPRPRSSSSSTRAARRGGPRGAPRVARALRSPLGTPSRPRRGGARVRKPAEASRVRSPSISSELLGARGRRRLERERTEPLRDLVLEVARLVDLDCDARELQLGAVAPALEAAEACRLLDERAALGRLRGEDLLLDRGPGR